MPRHVKRTPEQLAESYRERGKKISASLKARYAHTPPAPLPSEIRERIASKIRGQKRTPEQIERMKEAKRAYRAVNKLSEEERRARGRARRSAYGKLHNRRDKAKRMGAPPEAATQKHCDACGTTDVYEMGKRNHHLDHDHATGRFRGVLCGFCNVVLGKCEKKPHRFSLIGGGLLSYARKHGCCE